MQLQKKNNQFTSLATEWCTTKDTHDLHKELGKQLKDIIKLILRLLLMNK